MKQIHFADLVADIPGFKKLSSLLKKLTGINLISVDKNHSLMASRLRSIIQNYGLEDYLEYYDHIQKEKATALQEFVSALTTNTTQFFREPDQFKEFEQRFMKVYEKRMKQNLPVRIWCAATSTGQEPYTLMMIMLSLVPNLQLGQLKMLATDIDLDVLSSAAAGSYNSNEVKGLNHDLRKKFFLHHKSSYQIKPEVASFITFAQFNLLTPQFPFKHHFDFIFCRNVLIYFDQSTVKHVVHEMERVLSPEGAIFLGLSESGCGRTAGLHSVGPAVFTPAKRRHSNAA